MKIYGVINNDNVLIDISLSQKATKKFASMNQYNKIGYRVEYNVFVSHEKVNNKWIEIKK